MEEHYPYSPPSVAGGRSAPPQEPPASVEQGGSKWLVILLSIVALATMIWALAYTSIWYLDLFYQEPWFDEEPIDPYQRVIRSYIDGQLRTIAIPLIVTNGLTLLLLWSRTTPRRQPALTLPRGRSASTAGQLRAGPSELTP